MSLMEPARDGLVLHQGAVDDRPESDVGDCCTAFSSRVSS